MKKILFGITGLSLGGAERVLVDIANSLCHEYDITILLENSLKHNFNYSYFRSHKIAIY